MGFGTMTYGWSRANGDAACWASGGPPWEMVWTTRIARGGQPMHKGSHNRSAFGGLPRLWFEPGGGPRALRGWGQSQRVRPARPRRRARGCRQLRPLRPPPPQRLPPPRRLRRDERPRRLHPRRVPPPPQGRAAPAGRVTPPEGVSGPTRGSLPAVDGGVCLLIFPMAREEEKEGGRGEGCWPNQRYLSDWCPGDRWWMVRTSCMERTPNDPEKWVFPSSPPPAPRAGEWTGRQGALCSFFCSFCSCCLRLLAFLKVFLPGFQFSLFFFVAVPLVVKVI